MNIHKHTLFANFTDSHIYLFIFLSQSRGFYIKEIIQNLHNSYRPIKDEVTTTIKKIQQQNNTEEGNILFNVALNTFYLRLYGIRHMVKDHSDSERGNSLLPHRQQGFFYMHHPTERIIHSQPLLLQSWITGWSEK